MGCTNSISWISLLTATPTVAMEARFDPDNIFLVNQNIKPRQSAEMSAP